PFISQAHDLLPFFCFDFETNPLPPRSFPTRRSSDLRFQPDGPFEPPMAEQLRIVRGDDEGRPVHGGREAADGSGPGKDEVDGVRSEEHTSELQSRENVVCRLMLEKKKKANATRKTGK